MSRCFKFGSPSAVAVAPSHLTLWTSDKQESHKPRGYARRRCGPLGQVGMVIVTGARGSLASCSHMQAYFFATHLTHRVAPLSKSDEQGQPFETCST